jgi:AraC family L-rhamnose operon transcriptional activator RhaR/AraC family L-rhamnose operon regulatory protein RhaS
MYPEKLPLSNPPIYTSDWFFGTEVSFWASSYIMKNYSLNMHAQEWTEVNIVISGNGMHYLGEKKFPVNKGDIFIVPPNVLHGYVCGEALDVYHIGIHPQFFQEYSKELKSLPLYFSLFEIEPTMRMHGAHEMHLTLSDTEFSKIDLVLSMLCDVYNDKSSSRLVLSSGLTLVFISMLCNIYSNHQLNLSTSLHGDTNFMKSIAYIYEHYSEKITIDDLSTIANRSRNSYVSMFQKYMKNTPAKFLLDYRLNQAQTLISQTKMTITNVAESVGFYDLAHFLHCFKEKYGVTPTQYRKLF